ncbi:MAG: DNA polymerase III subunit beta [Bacilli bacterium]|nr:DNA polymerase III subunit beta [Bacilli bacterium]
MRCVIEKEQFIKGLTMVSKAIPQKAELPILSNVKLDLCEKGLVLIGSDNNIIISTVVPYMIDEKEIIRNAQFGETCVQCKLVLEVVRHMEDEYITLELVDNSILKIEDSKANFKLNSIRGDEYPQIDLTVSNGFIEVKANDIRDLVDQTSFAASMKETRPILTAINFDAEGGKLTATATDTARLARKSVAIDSDAHFVANIPAKKMVDIVRSFENEEFVSVAVSDNKAIFKFG